MKQYTSLGKTVNTFSKLDTIETDCGLITYHSDQLTSGCPVTGQPDFYDVTIELIADGVGIETKTLKLYLETFRDKQEFCENLAVKICEDICKVSNPTKCSVQLVQRRRGGIQITATHELSGVMIDG